MSSARQKNIYQMEIKISRFIIVEIVQMMTSLVRNVSTFLDVQVLKYIFLSIYIDKANQFVLQRYNCRQIYIFSDGFNPWTWVGIGAGIVFCVCVLGILVCKRIFARRKKGKAHYLDQYGGISNVIIIYIEYNTSEFLINNLVFIYILFLMQLLSFHKGLHPLPSMAW